MQRSRSLSPGNPTGKKVKSTLKEKTYGSVTKKKILKILVRKDNLSKNKIFSLAKMSRKRCADSIDSMVKDQLLSLQNERYAITEIGVSYLEGMVKRDKQDRQSRSQITG
jgi:predicted transcriptional regulator